MPILAATDQPQKRRKPVWALVLALLLLPPVGLSAWSWVTPVDFTTGWLVNPRNLTLGRPRGATFGRQPADRQAPAFLWEGGPTFWCASWLLPDQREYFIFWVWTP
jgi:hypothetical protein